MIDSSDHPNKGQLVDELPKRFRGLKFGIQSNQDIASQAVVEVSNRLLYDIQDSRSVYEHGPLDPHMGISSKQGRCSTCHEPLKDCTGHFGYVRLPLPVFHIGYLRFIMAILQEICKDCGRVLLEEPDRRSFLKELRRPHLDNLRRSQIHKRINAQCRKCKTCPYCGSINGQVRKIGVIKLAHDKFSAYNKSTSAKKVPPDSKIKFEDSFSEACRENPEVNKHLRKAMEDMNPLKVLKLFKSVSPTDCELLGFNAVEGRPEMLIWQYLPAPPVCVRPSVMQDNAGSNEDDLTAKLADIVWVSGMIRSALQKGSSIQTVMEQWEYLQTQIALYVNSDVPGLQQPGFGKTIRGFCQRLKGKQGRFRGNLSGKRVDFSGRTVISPDPNLGVDQVAVPQLVAKNLTYPEMVQAQNIEKLRMYIRNGHDVWPGAQAVLKLEQGKRYKVNLKFGNREEVAQNLSYGDIVERHLEDGDIVLFNRQPSLHKLSIMAHLVKVRPWRTFRLNECVCNPYNADFDGDEMNLHVPQTEEARAEALNLMGVKYNLVTPRNGEPIIAATQDFITAAFLLSSKDNFFDRKTFTYMCMHMLQGEHMDLPPPAIVAPRQLWTGKQIFNVLMRPSHQSPIKINLDAKGKNFNSPATQCPDMDANDGWVSIRNSEVMCGQLDKATVGSGKKNSIFYVILRDFGPDEAVAAMNRLAKLCARYLTNRGFSIGVGDVFPAADLGIATTKLIATAYRQTDSLIDDFKKGKLKKATGCDVEQTLENSISGILSKVRQQAGQSCVDTLSRNNAPLLMAKSGSKGSEINVAQMVALVGQQIIGGKRVPDGFQDRSLPHFHKNARQPPSKGFVQNSFYSGLTPTEFLFHAISGREGLVDTAVKTAETGYMSRRLMKSLEDLSIQYDNTVRTSNGGNIVQFEFGADNLDPVSMEGSAAPVNFQRTWSHAENVTRDNDEDSLTPADIKALCRAMLDKERKKFPRRGLLGEKLEYADSSDYAIDEHEGGRNFLREIETFVDKSASKLSRLQKLNGCDEEDISSPVLNQLAKVSSTHLTLFIRLCMEKFRRAHVEPGHGVGAVGAQSIGEPGTQMTLKTFHFAGVAGMSITQGVPRIKEIINASTDISTPVITCPLLNNKDIEAAKIIKGRIEKTYISDIISSIEDEWRTQEGNVILQIDMNALADMHLGISVHDIARAVCKQRDLKLQPDDISINGNRIAVHVGDGSRSTAKRSAKDQAQGAGDMLLRANVLRRSLPLIPICGYPHATRALIETSETNTNRVLVEGYGLQACMNTEGVVGTETRSNSVLECGGVLGIEAARTTIATEMQAVMGDMGIDPRHMELLADVMTFKGEVLGITRFGLSKMRDSVLHLASFEKTPDHLFEAAARMKTDQIEGVSESIIMGQAMNVGTGAFQVVRRLGIQPRNLQPKPTLFGDAWDAELATKRMDQKARLAAASA